MTTYAEVYAEQFEELADRLYATKRAALADWVGAIKAEQKRRQPRRKEENRDPLPESYLEPLRATILAKYPVEQLGVDLKRLRDERTAKLNELAAGVEFKSHDSAVPVEVGSCHVSSYSSQGYGASKYAKATLQPLAYVLGQRGISTDLTEHEGVWTLRAACPRWMADAAERLITLHEVSVACGRAVNLKVLNPFLPHEMLDRHFAGTL